MDTASFGADFEHDPCQEKLREFSSSAARPRSTSGTFLPA
jgi:hypothetical protein